MQGSSLRVRPLFRFCQKHLDTSQGCAYAYAMATREMATPKQMSYLRTLLDRRLAERISHEGSLNVMEALKALTLEKASESKTSASSLIDAISSGVPALARQVVGEEPQWQAWVIEHLGQPAEVTMLYRDQWGDARYLNGDLASKTLPAAVIERLPVRQIGRQVPQS